MTDNSKDPLNMMNIKRFSCFNSTSIMILISLGESIGQQGKGKRPLFNSPVANLHRKNTLQQLTEDCRFQEYIKDLAKLDEKQKNPDVYMVNVRFHRFRFLGNFLRGWCLSTLFSLIVNRKLGYKKFKKDYSGSPFDLLITVNCEEQFRDWVKKRTKDMLSEISANYKKMCCDVFYCANYKFEGFINPGDNVLLSGFLVRWRKEIDKDELWQKSYWLNNHGPLALKLGLPGDVKSYVQSHFSLKPSTVNQRYIDNNDLEKLRKNSLHHEFEGIAFQTIKHAWWRFIWLAVSSICLNIKLVADEIMWTQSAQYLMFEPVLFIQEKEKDEKKEEGEENKNPELNKSISNDIDKSTNTTTLSN